MKLVAYLMALGILILIMLFSGFKRPVRHIESSPGKEMVLIEGGVLEMGNPKQHYQYRNQQPVHQVRIEDFWLGKYEVSNQEYIAFLSAQAKALQVDTLDHVGEGYVGLRYGPDILVDVKLPGMTMSSCGIGLGSLTGEVPEVVLIKGFEQYPVLYVTWQGARQYCQWKYKQGHLPSEAQWEYAAKGGKQGQQDHYLYAGSDSLSQVGWYWENAGFKPHPVGEKQPNQLGLYDMSGNLWEWVEDHWHEDYQGAPVTARPWLEKKVKKDHTRVLRGGAWLYHRGEATTMNRWKDVPDDRHDYKGFRCACKL